MGEEESLMHIKLLRKGTVCRLPDIERTEADIQFAIGRALLATDPDLRVYFEHTCDSQLKTKQRMDILVAKMDVPLCVLEVKKRKSPLVINTHYYRQVVDMTAFTNAGLPATVVTSEDEALAFVQKILQSSSTSSMRGA